MQDLLNLKEQEHNMYKEETIVFIMDRNNKKILRNKCNVQDDLYQLVNNVSSFKTKQAINNCDWVEVYSGLDRDISRLRRLTNVLEEAQKIVGNIVIE